MAALFKQATLGDITDEEPTREEDRASWKAWSNLKGTSNQDAMKQYIHLLTSSKTEWEECERFAREAEKVSELMKEMDIKESACVACKADKEGGERPPEAYIWTEAQRNAQAQERPEQQPEKQTWAAMARQNLPEKEPKDGQAISEKKIEQTVPSKESQEASIAKEREQEVSEKATR
jgi:hypothetical protein